MTKLSKEDAEKIVSYLKEKWQGRTCPMCQTGNWIVQDNCFQLMRYDANAFVIGGTVIPVIPVICNNCSNTLLINAILAGVINPKEKANPESEKSISSNIDKDSQ